MTTMYAPQAAASHGQFVQLNNIEMYYEEYGAGEPLLLLHGFGGCTQNWYPFIAELSVRYRLIVVDLRGHGYSTNPDHTFTHRQAAHDVLCLLEKLGITQCAAMGISSGGMTLLHMATRQPGCINAMVLISTTTHFPEQARAIMRGASLTNMPPAVQQMYRACARRGDEQIRQLIAQFNAFQQNNDDMNFTAQDLSTITARTLIVHGDRDRFFPIEIAENLSRSIADTELWIIPGGDHAAIYDPAVPFTSTALRFLERVTQSSEG